LVSTYLDGLQVEFRRMPVDLAAIFAAILTSGMPDPGWWLKDWR
jgi:hypothetical protein